MARKQIVQFIDDIDGQVLEEFETVRWSLDGRQFEFDTSPEHAGEFRELVAKYVDASRSVAKTRTVKQRIGASAGGGRSKEATQAIRDWANQNGYEVSDRGRIPHNVEEAYDAAH